MSIKDFTLKIKPYLNLLIFLLLLSIIFGIVYIYSHSPVKTPIEVTFVPIQNKIDILPNNETSTTTETGKSGGVVVGSKNGTKYYYPWCGALNRIKPENRVQFTSVAIAMAKGYTPAKNCKGVE